jgi:hypothetical protein
MAQQDIGFGPGRCAPVYGPQDVAGTADVQIPGLDMGASQQPPPPDPAASVATPQAALPTAAMESTPEEFMAQQRAFGIKEDPLAEYKQQIASMAGESQLDRAQARNMALVQAGLGIMGGTSPYAFENIGKGAAPALTQYATSLKDIKAQERDLFKMQAEIAKADDALKRGDFKAYQEANERVREYRLKLQKAATEERQVSAYERAANRRTDEELRQEMFRTDRAGFEEYQKAMRPGFETAAMQRDKVILEQINNALLTMKRDNPDRKTLEAERQRILARLSGQSPTGTTEPPNIQALLYKHAPKAP